MSDEIIQILKSQGRALETQGKMLESHGKILESHGEQLDVLARTVVDHTERLDRIEEKMATKDDLRVISKTLDHLVVLAEKKDQELTVLGHNVKNLNNRVEVLEKDVKQMKPALGLS